ncbi:methylenetetrahydrofolate reductase [NAD(P)H] [Amylibacter sp.]|nr:methylenetetrahydrofolate reductase [NAD(P)H] [Amylibacter sp.]
MDMNHKNFGLSFEIFPPRNLKASFKLWRTIEVLEKLNPNFISVTYGAGGSTRELTQSAVSVIAKEYNIDVAGHLTCVGSTKKEIMDIALKYGKAGASKIVALRGDSPEDQGSENNETDNFSSSVELIASLKKNTNFELYVAAYPNVHPNAQSEKSDLDVLKAKFDAGADSAITQFFFDKEDFLRFRDKCNSAGIYQNIIPGILPVENWSKTKIFAKRCGMDAPQWMSKAYENCKNNEEHNLLSQALCTEMCDELMQEGVNNLHFYTLNNPKLTQKVCEALGRKVIPTSITKVA